MNRHLSLLLSFSFLCIFFGVASTPNSFAADCPAIRINDAPYELRGKEVISNSGKLSFGVRLFWLDPDSNRPNSLEIWRKKRGDEFKKIAQVTPGKETYLDANISKDVNAYTYAVKAVFLCGGSLYSSPVTVETSARKDLTPPSVSLLAEPNSTISLPPDGSVYILLKDAESGINRDLSTYKREKSSASVKLMTTGSNKALLARIPVSALTSGKQQVTINTTNGAGKKASTILDLDIKIGEEAAYAIDNLAQSPISIKKPIPIALKELAEGQQYRIKASIDDGKNWPTIYEGTNTTPSIQLSSVFADSITPGYVTLKISLWQNNQLLGEETLPLIVGDTMISLENISSTLVPLRGTVELRDAITDKAQLIPGFFFNEGKDQTSVTISDEGSIETLAPIGDYTVVENSDAYSIRSVPSVSTASGGVLKLQVELASQPISRKFARTEEEIAILSNIIEPEELISIDQKIEAKQHEQANIEPSEEKDTLEITSSIQSLICSNTCIKQTFTSTSDSISLAWDPSKQEFSSLNGLQKRETVPLGKNSSSIITFSLSRNYTFSLSKKVLTSISASTPVSLFAARKEGDKITITPSSNLTTSLIKENIPFVKIKTGASCNEYTTKFMSSNETKTGYLPSFCNETLSTHLVPIGSGFTLQETSHSYTPVYSSDNWYATYINVFDQAGIFTHKEAEDPHNPLTRSQFATMLRKALFLPETPGLSDLEIMAKQGLVSGREVAPNKFDLAPDAPINRAETVKLLLSAFPQQNNVTLADLPFKDIEKNKWYYPFLQKAYALKIIEGHKQQDDSYIFFPEHQVTRAEASKLLYEIMLSTLKTLP